MTDWAKENHSPPEGREHALCAACGLTTGPDEATPLDDPEEAVVVGRPGNADSSTLNACVDTAQTASRGTCEHPVTHPSERYPRARVCGVCGEVLRP